MKFKETGAILNQNKQILYWVEGTAAEVIFPQELTWKIHKASPGSVWAFAHVHPPGMIELSHEDITTCRAWCTAIHPWPFRFITITEVKSRHHSVYVESIYLGQLESREDWIKRGKKGERQFTIELENRKEYSHREWKQSIKPKYINLLWRKAHE